MENNIVQGQNTSTESNERSISIRDIVFLVLNNWYWFVISVLVCLVAAGFIYKAQPKTYTATGTILVRDNDKKGGYSNRNMDAMLNSMGMQSGGLAIENEIYLLRSSWLMAQVVERLNINHYCQRNDLFRKITYYKDAPVNVEVTDLKEDRQAGVGLKIDIKSNNKFAYTTIWKNKKVKGEAYFNESVALDDTVSFVVEKTSRYNDSFEGVSLTTGVYPVMPLARRMIKNLTVARADKMASILNITYQDSNPLRANEIVDTLIVVYNDDAVEDKNKVAQKTEEFIAERIILISGELGDVDAEVAQLKKEANVPDFEGTTSTLLQTGTKYSEQVVQLEAEHRLIEYMKNFVSDPDNHEKLIPANVAISDPGTQQMIAAYNANVNQYDRVKTTGGKNNPTVRNLVATMEAQMQAINTSIDNILRANELRLREARAQEAKARGQIAAIPTQTKAVTEVGRQQKIKEELYLYLLSKREETAMNLAITMANAKVVEPAVTRLSGPRLMMFGLIAIVLGLAIPAAVMFLISFFDTKLRTKQDVEKMTSLPVLGEIPSKPENRKNDEIIVTANGTDVVTEAFRLLHSNIPFFLKVPDIRELYSVCIRSFAVFRNKVKLCGSIMDHIQTFRSASGYLLSAHFGTDYYSIRFIDNTGLAFFNYPFCNSRYIISVNIVIENIVDKSCTGGPGNKSGKRGIKITCVDRVISPLTALYKAADHLLIFQNIENVFNTCSRRCLDTRSADPDRITVEL